MGFRAGRRNTRKPVFVVDKKPVIEEKVESIVNPEVNPEVVKKDIENTTKKIEIKQSIIEEEKVNKFINLKHLLDSYFSSKDRVKFLQNNKDEIKKLNTGIQRDFINNIRS
jgi:hypothetical protein